MQNCDWPKRSADEAPQARQLQERTLELERELEALLKKVHQVEAKGEWLSGQVVN